MAEATMKAELGSEWQLRVGKTCSNMAQVQIGDTTLELSLQGCGERCFRSGDCVFFSFPMGASQGSCTLASGDCEEGESPDSDLCEMLQADAVKMATEAARQMNAETWQREVDYEAKEELLGEEDGPSTSGVEDIAEYNGSGSPPNITRDFTYYDWCPVGKGLAFVKLWPKGDRSKVVKVESASVRWVRWASAVKVLRWQCDGSKKVGTTRLPRELEAMQWLSLQVTQDKRTGLSGLFKSGLAGRLRWNGWQHTSYLSSVPFTSKTEGYACFKIPSYLLTKRGALLAFAEARNGSCGDFDGTEIVFKRSLDGGQTWGALRRLVEVEGDRAKMGVCGYPLVIGNAAPGQLGLDSMRHPGRILVPHTRNNFEMWLVYSDDEGETWSNATEIKGVTRTEGKPDCDRGMGYFGLASLDEISLATIPGVVKWLTELCSGAKGGMLDPYSNPRWSKKLTGPWQFLGTGPPGSLQLKSGRFVVPCYHSYIRGLSNGTSVSQLYNNFALGHVVYSDDDGETWRLGWEGRPIGNGLNENSVVALPNGSLLLNGRSLATGSPQFRLQAISDDGGETFAASEFKKELPQPFNGCQGSSVSGAGETVFTATPDPLPARSLVQGIVDKLPGCSSLEMSGRTRVSVWRSRDAGGSFPEKVLLDEGRSAQTALQHRDGALTLLYEQADEPPEIVKERLSQYVLQDLVVLLPDRLVFREVTEL